VPKNKRSEAERPAGFALHTASCGRHSGAGRTRTPDFWFGDLEVSGVVLDWETLLRLRGDRRYGIKGKAQEIPRASLFIGDFDQDDIVEDFEDGSLCPGLPLARRHAKADNAKRLDRHTLLLSGPGTEDLN
jgi:hypothetical protein